MVTSIQLCEVSKHCLSFQREREIRRERHEYNKYKPRLFLCEFLTCMCFMFFKGYILCKPSVSYSSTELHISIATEMQDRISYWLAQQCEIEKEREREKGWHQREGNVPALRFTAGGSRPPTIPTGANLHTHRTHTQSLQQSIMEIGCPYIAMATPPTPH